MSAMQRRKGARAEIELCKLLSDELGVTVRRNVDQARVGGADCLELPGYAIEVKRCERLAIPAWWRQAVVQAQAAGAEPVLFFRQSRKEWRVVMTGGAEVPFDWAMDLMRDKLARLFGIYREAA